MLKKFIVCTAILAMLNSQQAFGDQMKNHRRTLASQSESQATKDEICNELNDDVDVKGGKVVSDSERESWESNSESIRNARDKNTLEDYFSGKNDSLSDLATQVLKYAGVYIVFTALSVLGFVCYIFCCVCESCCPPCKLCVKSCKRSKEYQGFGKYWSAVGAYLGCIMIFVMSIVGLTETSGLENSFHVFSCAGLSAFHGISYGGGNFKGVDWLKTQLTKFKQEDLNNIITSTGETFSGSRPDWVDVEKEVMDRLSTAMNLEDCSAAVPSGSCGKNGCKPIYTASQSNVEDFNLALEGESAQTWSSGKACPDSDLWSPEISTYTYATDFGTGTQKSIYFGTAWEGLVKGATSLYEAAYKGITTSVDGIESAAKTITDQTGSLGNTIQSAIDQIVDFQDQVINLMNDISTFHSDYKGYLKSFTTAMNIFMYLFIFFSVIIAVIITLVYFKNMFKLRYILHSCWALQSFVVILTFIFTTVMMSISITGEQTCEIMDKALNDPNQFDTFSSKVDKEVREKIKICKKELNPSNGPYNGEDDISTAFGIEKQLQDIRNLRDELKGFLSEDGEFNQAKVKLQKAPANLDIILDQLTELKEKQSFTQDSVTKIDHASVEGSIKTFNDASCSNNEIQADKDDCNNDERTSFTGSDKDDTVCFGMQPSMDFTGHAARYTGCDDAKTQINLLVTWREEKNDIVNLKEQQTKGLKNQLRYYIALHAKYTQDVEKFNTGVISSLNFIAHETDGIIAQVKCFWFGTQLDLLYDAFCVSFVNSCYGIGFVMGIFSISMYFTVFFIYISVRRMGVNQKLSKQIAKPSEEDFQKEDQQEQDYAKQQSSPDEEQEQLEQNQLQSQNEQQEQEQMEVRIELEAQPEEQQVNSKDDLALKQEDA